VTTPRLILRVLPGTFAICRLAPDAAVPSNISNGALHSVTRTATELSIVCEQHLAPAGAKCERDWACLSVDGPLAFDAVGVLAALVAPLAAANISIFSISTFDTDHLLVSRLNLPRAIDALRAAGHEVRS
jgi:hypothetical protein